MILANVHFLEERVFMRMWVQFFAGLYGLGLAGLALRGIFPLPPWFFLLGSVLFVVPLGYLLTRAGHVLAQRVPAASPWIPWIAIASGLVLLGIYGQLLAAAPIVFLAFLG